MSSLLEIDKLILKFNWKFKGFRLDKTILGKKIKVGGFTYLNFKIYYKVTLIKAVWYCHKDRHRSNE